jgi:ankyrin repeat protein
MAGFCGIFPECEISNFNKPAVFRFGRGSMKISAKLLSALLLTVFFLSSCASPRGPLHYSALKGETTQMQLLIYRGEDINQRNRQGDTPLHLAAFSGKTDIIKMLLENGAEVDVLHQYNAMTPLHKAALWGHKETVKMLLDWGADINARDEKGETPLYKASFKGKWDVVQLLLDNGARL